MFIIIIGTRASGKSTIKEYLLQHKKFKHVRLVYSGKTKGSLSSVDEDGQTFQSIGNGDVASDTGLKLDNPKSFISMTTSSASNIAEVLKDEPNTVPDIDGALGFTDPARLLDHITRNWRDNFVTEDITTRAVLEPFLKRPFVLLVSVDAPTLTRYTRYQKYSRSPPAPSKFNFFSNRTLFSSSRHGPPSSQAAAESLENFVADDDRISFGPDSDNVTTAYLFASQHLCHVNIINAFPKLEQLYSHLEVINLLNMDRLRPSWDSYFMKLASLASHRSNCMKRRVGAILVRDHSIIATGYNGTPFGVPNCNQGGCKRCNEGVPRTVEGFEECLCIHAEENALLEAGRERARGAIIYCNTCPCLKCTIKIVQNGVREVVYNLSYKMDASSARVFQTAGVEMRQYSPPA
ncbi:DCD1 [Sanghuangporus weigelae]